MNPAPTPRRFSTGRTLIFTALVFLTGAARATEVKVVNDLRYLGPEVSDSETYARCRLDLYLPDDGKITAALLWFHGGGLKGGQRDSAATQRIARRFAEAGIAVASAGYRLSPSATFPAYVEDAAAAYAWLQNHVANYGGDPQRVFIGGHSAGAYLALMVALDEQRLQRLGIDVETIAGVIAVSGQTTTHFTVRTERGLEAEQIIVDEGAPLFHAKKRQIPFQLLFAGHDMALRIEENRLLAAALRHAGASRVEAELFSDRDHSTIITRMAEPDDAVAKAIFAFMKPASAMSKPLSSP